MVLNKLQITDPTGTLGKRDLDVIIDFVSPIPIPKETFQTLENTRLALYTFLGEPLPEMYRYTICNNTYINIKVSDE